MIAFKLGGAAQLPPLAEVPPAKHEPPEFDGAATSAARKLAYHIFCTVCRDAERRGVA